MSKSLRLPKDQAEILRARLEEHGFTLSKAAYAFWRAKRPGCMICFYRSGKLLIQGRHSEGWKKRLQLKALEPQAFAEALALHPNPPPDEWIGSDETGKGDYFGPLVVAAVSLKRSKLPLLVELGVDDSKRLKDLHIQAIAPELKELLEYEILVLEPQEYNRRYAQLRNLNILLAWAHGEVVEALLERTSADFVLSDRFTTLQRMWAGFGPLGRACRFYQRHRAEDDPAVAAASILARAAFLEAMEKLSERFNLLLPKGSGAGIIEAGRRFLKERDPESLVEIAKLHFSLTQKINQGLNLKD